MNEQRIIFAASLILFFSAARPLTAQPGSTGLYQRALIAYAGAKAERDGVGKGIVVLENNILQDAHVVEIFPPKIDSTPIEYLSANAIKERCRKTGQEIRVVELLPMREYQGLLIVRCAEFGAYVKHGKLILGVYGGYEVQWRFDCLKGEYVKVKENWYAGLVM